MPGCSKSGESVCSCGAAGREVQPLLSGTPGLAPARLEAPPRAAGGGGGVAHFARRNGLLFACWRGRSKSGESVCSCGAAGCESQLLCFNAAEERGEPIVLLRFV